MNKKEDLNYKINIKFFHINYNNNYDPYYRNE